MGTVCALESMIQIVKKRRRRKENSLGEGSDGGMQDQVRGNILVMGILVFFVMINTKLIENLMKENNLIIFKNYDD